MMRAGLRGVVCGVACDKVDFCGEGGGDVMCGMCFIPTACGLYSCEVVVFRNVTVFLPFETRQPESGAWRVSRLYYVDRLTIIRFICSHDGRHGTREIVKSNYLNFLPFPPYPSFSHRHRLLTPLRSCTSSLASMMHLPTCLRYTAS